MVTFNGDTKLIVVSGTYSINVKNDLYDAAVAWAVQSGNMKYLLPMASSGKNPLGGGVYTDSIFILENGWKLQPSGYVEGDQILVNGTLITSDNSARTVNQVVGYCPVWTFQVATAGTQSIVSVGSGLSEAEHNALFAIRNEVL